MLGAFLNVVTWLTLLVLDLVLYLCVSVLFTMMYLFCNFSTSGVVWGCGSNISAWVIPILLFGIFPIFGVTANFLLG